MQGTGLQQLYTLVHVSIHRHMYGYTKTYKETLHMLTRSPSYHALAVPMLSQVFPDGHIVERGPYRVRIEFDSNLTPRETILFIQERIDAGTGEYTIDSASQWRRDIEIIGVPNPHADVIYYPFTGIINYMDSVLTNIEYLHGGSVCKIRIEY